MRVERQIPLETAHQILATFGITQPSPLYERRIKPNGFTMVDLHEVIADESRFLFRVDWRAVLIDELPRIAAALSEFGCDISIQIPKYADEGWIECAGKRERVKYVPSEDDDFTDVVLAVQKLILPTIEFRESTSNGDSDGWGFAVLLRDEWSSLESLDRHFIKEMWRPPNFRREGSR